MTTAAAAAAQDVLYVHVTGTPETDSLYTLCKSRVSGDVSSFGGAPLADCTADFSAVADE